MSAIRESLHCVIKKIPCMRHGRSDWEHTIFIMRNPYIMTNKSTHLQVAILFTPSKHCGWCNESCDLWHHGWQGMDCDGSDDEIIPWVIQWSVYCKWCDRVYDPWVCRQYNLWFVDWWHHRSYNRQYRDDISRVMHRSNLTMMALPSITYWSRRTNYTIVQYRSHHLRRIDCTACSITDNVDGWHYLWIVASPMMIHDRIICNTPISITLPWHENHQSWIHGLYSPWS